MNYRPTDEHIERVRERMALARAMLAWHGEFDKNDEQSSLHNAVEAPFVLAYAGGHGLKHVLESACDVLESYFEDDPACVEAGGIGGLERVDEYTAHEIFKVKEFYDPHRREVRSDDTR